MYRNGKRLHEFDEADLDVCYEVNVKGTFFGAKAAIRQMLEQARACGAGLVGEPVSHDPGAGRNPAPCSRSASNQDLERDRVLLNTDEGVAGRQSKYIVNQRALLSSVWDR